MKNYAIKSSTEKTCGTVKTASSENVPKHNVHNGTTTDTTISMEYRVIFLGDSEAGKTLIMSRIKDSQMNPSDFREDTTNGINTYSKVECLNGQKIRINYWDFGGQDILNSMHRMFLSNDTLYVIVLNTRNDNQDAQASFWIRYVQSYAPRAPVMLVMNKSDQNKRAALNFPALFRKFPTLRLDESDVLKISAIMPDSRKFRKRFVAKLFQRIARCIHDIPPFTEQEAQIRDALKEKKEKVVKIDDFRKICRQHGLTDRTEQVKLMQRFNNAGIMVYFGEGKPVLLDPQWITKAIYLILDAQDSTLQNGIVKHETIRQLCEENPENWMGSYDANHLLDIMRGYDLSFEYKESVQEFIPMLCQRREPVEIEALIHANDTIEFQMSYEYLPSGVLYKMMSNHQEELDTKLTWRTGAKIGHGNENYAILRQDSNVIKLFVHYSDKACAVNRLGFLAEEIRTYAEHERYRAKSLENKIGFEVAGIMEYFDYDRLMKAKSAKVEYVASKIKSVRVAVSDILEQEDRSERRDLDELLRLTLIGCKELQDDQTYWWRKKQSPDVEACLPKMDEDSRTRRLKSAIEYTFFAEDQHKGSESATGISRGEMDLRICLNRGDPWSILEAINIKNETGASKTDWLKHLDKLANKYNQSKFRYLILVSYLLAPEAEFERIKNAYHKLLQGTKLESCGGKPKDCNYETPKSCPGNISISRADYPHDVSIFHFLVYIPEYKGKQKKTTTNNKKQSTASQKKQSTKSPDPVI